MSNRTNRAERRGCSRFRLHAWSPGMLGEADVRALHCEDQTQQRDQHLNHDAAGRRFAAEQTHHACGLDAGKRREIIPS